jgi:amidohydrolase
MRRRPSSDISERSELGRIMPIEDNMTTPKDLAWQAIRRHEAELRALALRLRDNPEVGYQEEKASAWLAEYLAQQGFAVTKPFGGLPTAFNACRASGDGPTIAYLAEYDALPGVGHGCGHNLIAGACVAAGIGVAAALGQVGGRVCVIGTPAEEFADMEEGKVKLLRAGAFEGVDVALSMHPHFDNQIMRSDIGFIGFELVFHGRPAHAAADPWNGANALDGLVLTYMNMNALRQHVRPDVRMHGIITDGGRVPNIIPERAAGRFMVRSRDPKVLEDVYARVQECAKAAAQATGTTVDIVHITTVYNTRIIPTLNRLFAENFAQVGEPLAAEPLDMGGSTDFGNVSQVIPAAFFVGKTHPAGIPWHSTDVTKGAGEEMALHNMIASGCVLAGAAIDLMSDPATLAQVRSDFARGEKKT